MTIPAGDVHVSTVQQKVCLYIVIEQPQVPGNRVVAGATGAVEHTIVRVIFQMAANTVVVGIMEQARLVTFDAFDIGMHTEQGELGKTMVEKRPVDPFGLIVTIAALVTELASMRVVVQMTGRAIIARLDLENRLHVTIGAGGLAVRRAQHEVRASREWCGRPRIPFRCSPRAHHLRGGNSRNSCPLRHQMDPRCGSHCSLVVRVFRQAESRY